MRYLALLLIFASSAGFAETDAAILPARASESVACYNIGDADARTYCLARAHRDPGRCYSIQRADLRSMCLAEVRK